MSLHLNIIRKVKKLIFTIVLIIPKILLENFIFNEKGFAKIALKWIRLRFSKSCGGSSSRIWIVINGDYDPYLESYADYFLPKCRIHRNYDFLNTQEYLKLEKTYDRNLDLRLGKKPNST